MPEPSPSRVPVKVEAAGDTHIGGRSHNEDAILLRPDLNLYLLADGAGGQNAGNVAASLATTTIAHFFERTRKTAAELPKRDAIGLPVAARRLSTAVQQANQEILEISKRSDRHKGMGTTIVAALIVPEHGALHLAHVGDSRCYRLRDGRMELLTSDHSLINDILELRPNISDERVKQMPKNVITRALGMMDNLRVSISSHEIAHGDRYLICSDGLTDVVHEKQIFESLQLDAPCDEMVGLLVNMAIDAGTDDNVATVIIDCALPTGSGQAATRPMRTGRKKSSRPKMRRIEPEEEPEPAASAHDRESVPEIVHFDESAEDGEARPSVTFVPRDSQTPGLAEAVAGVMSGEPDDDERGSSPVPEAPTSSAGGSRRPTRDFGDEPDSDPGEEPGRNAMVSPPRHARPSAKNPTPAAGTADKPAPKKGKDPTSAPRIHKAKSGGSSSGRTGQTRRPADSEGPPTAAGRHGEQTKGRAGANKPLPVPPVRKMLQTTDYSMEETLPCHACGSVIAADAESCQYCGAPTGFRIKE